MENAAAADQRRQITQTPLSSLGNTLLGSSVLSVTSVVACVPCSRCTRRPWNTALFFFRRPRYTAALLRSMRVPVAERISPNGVATAVFATRRDGSRSGHGTGSARRISPSPAWG